MSQPSFYNDLALPVVAAPMFLISGPEIVIECCKNGVIGTFPALNQRSTEGFEEWVIEIKEALAAFEKETGKKGIARMRMNEKRKGGGKMALPQCRSAHLLNRNRQHKFHIML